MSDRLDSLMESELDFVMDRTLPRFSEARVEPMRSQMTAEIAQIRQRVEATQRFEAQQTEMRRMQQEHEEKMKELLRFAA